MPKLTCTQAEFGNQSCELFDGTFSVGRSPRNQIILEAESVSNDHADLLVNGSEVIVRDRESKNGVFVDGIRIDGQRGVGHQQLIRFGTVEFRLEIAPSDPDDSTSFTAITTYQEYRRKVGESPAPLMTFPVRFAPGTPPQTHDGDSTLWLPRPAKAAESVAVPAEPIPRPDPLIPEWVWMTAAAGIGLAVLFWVL